MSFPEPDFGFLFGEPDFHDDNVLGFVDRKYNNMVRKIFLTFFKKSYHLVKPYHKGLSMEVVQSQSSAETHVCVDHFDFASEDPYIFGEPLNPTTHFAWDLPEARFRKEVKMMRQSSNKLLSIDSASPTLLPESPLEQQMLVHTLRVNVATSESNPNSKARLGPKELKEIGKETKMHPGQGVAPEFMKRSSLGAFGPVVTKIRKKRKTDTGTASAGPGGPDSVFDSHAHGRENTNLQEGKGMYPSIEDQDDATRLAPPPMDVVLE